MEAQLKMPWREVFPATAIVALVAVSALAALAALGRLLLGADPWSWRYAVGSVILAISISLLAFSAISHWHGDWLSAHAAVAIGTASGLFAEKIVRHAEKWLLVVLQKKMPIPPDPTVPPVPPADHDKTKQQ